MRAQERGMASHGVHADPWFRYSVRVDGIFEPDFLERIRRELRRR